MASIAVGRLAATKAALKGLSYLVSKRWHQPGSKMIRGFLPDTSPETNSKGWHIQKVTEFWDLICVAFHLQL